MGFYAAQWAFGLTPVQVSDPTHVSIVRAVAWHCWDETGYLRWPLATLARDCRLGVRTLQRHLPRLEKLTIGVAPILLRGDDGFRLPAFLRARQIGVDPRQNGAPYKELILSNSPLSPKVLKPSKVPAREKAVSERAGLNAEMLSKIWARILQKLRENIEPDLFAREWAPLALRGVNYRALTVSCPWPLDDHERERVEVIVQSAAEECGMLRPGRVVEVVVVKDRGGGSGA